MLKIEYLERLNKLKYEFLNIVKFWRTSSARHANESLTMKDRELKSMRRQLDSLSEDLTETSRTRDVMGRENRRLQDDLAVMTKENQVAFSLFFFFFPGLDFFFLVI